MKETTQDARFALCCPTSLPALTLFKGENVIGNLRLDSQRLLGSCVITVLDHVPEIDFLSDQVRSEFAWAQSAAVSAVRKAFDAPPLYFTIVNLKNGAYASSSQSDFSLGHFHAHIWPRWDTTIQVNACRDGANLTDTFSDPCIGQEYRSADYPPQPVAPIIAEEIAHRIRSSLPVDFYI